MHHSLSNTIISAHVRDLQRAMHPDRGSKRPRRPRLARIRQSR
jgi:DnaJ-domain-containing protein 1